MTNEPKGPGAVYALLLCSAFSFTVCCALWFYADWVNSTVIDTIATSLGFASIVGSFLALQMLE